MRYVANILNQVAAFPDSVIALNFIFVSIIENDRSEMALNVITRYTKMMDHTNFAGLVRRIRFHTNLAGATTLVTRKYDEGNITKMNSPESRDPKFL